MTISVAFAWLGFGVLMAWLGARGGALLWLSRAIDYTRAAVECARVCWDAVGIEWRSQWPEALHWARRNR